jgi:hypothetical protein
VIPDTGADFAQLWGLFVDFDVVASLHQAGGRRQPADPGAGDENSVLLHCRGAPRPCFSLVISPNRRAAAEPERLSRLAPIDR